MPRIAKCGTETGYARHKRSKETPCPKCVQAYREATRRRKQKQRAKSTGTRTKGAPKMNSIEDHEQIIRDLERTIHILNQAIESEEPKSNRNLSGLARALKELHAEVADRKAAIAELEAQLLESEEVKPDDPFDLFARALHDIASPVTENPQNVSVHD